MVEVVIGSVPVHILREGKHVGAELRLVIRRCDLAIRRDAAVLEVVDRTRVRDPVPRVPDPVRNCLIERNACNTLAR